MKSFGQEFYPHESIRALILADKAKISGRRELVVQIARLLPQPGEGTRERIAEKMVQRFLGGDGPFGSRRLAPPASRSFARLVARLRHAPTQIELLYFQLCQVDEIVGALARELFYPACVAGVPPEGISSAQFALHNGQLLATSPSLTRAFILHYARTRWNFEDASTIDRSLRVMQSAGLITRHRMTSVRRHPSAFHLSERDVSLITFVWALYNEFLPHAATGGLVLSRDVLPISDFARTLLLSPDQVARHCEMARRHQLLAGDGHSIRLVFGNPDVLADALLGL